MRRLLLCTAIAIPLAAAGSVPAATPQDPAQLALQRARAEADAGEAEVRRLQQIAAKSLGEAARLRAERLTAAQSIVAAEARISASDAEVRLIDARAAELSARLRAEQQPVASLLAGLAMMGRRPPLLAIADGGSTDELVRVRILVNSTLPVIRARTAGLSRQLDAEAALRRSAVEAYAKLQRSRSQLAEARQQFALLEQRALQAASVSSGRAVSAADTALAANETVETLSSDEAQSRLAASTASGLATEPAAPAGPSGSAAPRSRFAYSLPSDAPVIAGFGAINRSGVRSRGITMATDRGVGVRAPADGVVRFAGPFKSYDGIIILDHGRGWISLIVNVAVQLRPGDRVRAGEPVGRALGQIDVELSRNGQRLSPAIIAGSSLNLSKGSKPS
ncbi:MAG: murein hydrolase activator EnvC family protein [Sphingomicrobium sp.]